VISVLRTLAVPDTNSGSKGILVTNTMAIDLNDSPL
jgi:hypothetical protein